MSALDAYAVTHLHTRDNPSRAWSAPPNLRVSSSPTAAPPPPPPPLDDLYTAVTALPEPTPPNASTAPGIIAAASSFVGALNSMRDAVAPLRRARAVAGAPLGPLGAPNWPALEVAARDARTSALEALRVGVDLPSAELAEVACTARAVLSRALALESYVALCTGQPSSAWARTCDESLMDAFDTGRLEAVTARADAHASLEIQFLAESSPHAAPVPPFFHDADALLASAALILELRRCMYDGTPTGAVRVALEAARTLRASSLRTRGRFLVMRTVLGGARAVAPATGGRALDAARALILDGTLSEAAIEEVMWHSVRADILQIRALDARPNGAAEALSEARALDASMISIGLPASASLGAADVARLVARTRAQAADNLRAALAAGAVRGSPGALIAPFGGETEWLRTLTAVELAANSVLAHAPESRGAVKDAVGDSVEAAEDAPDSAEHATLERSARVLLRARRALLARGAMGISVLNSMDPSPPIEAGSEGDWWAAIRELRVTGLHSSCVAETLLLILSVRTYGVCTALAASFLQSSDVGSLSGGDSATFPSDTDTATPSRAITDAAALATLLNESDECAPPQLVSLVAVAGFILSLRAARASGDDAATIRATLASAVNAGTLSRLSPTTFALDGATANTLSMRVALSINSEVARAAAAADDSSAAAAALARADAIDNAVESALAARARARDHLVAGLSEALAAEDAGASPGSLEHTLAWAEGALSLAGGEGVEGGPLKSGLQASRLLVIGRAAVAARDWVYIADLLAPDAVVIAQAPGAAPAAAALARLATAVSVAREGNDFAGAVAIRTLRRDALGVAAVAMGSAALSAALCAASGKRHEAAGVVFANASIEAASARTTLPVSATAMSRAAKAIAALADSIFASGSSAAAASAVKALAEIESAIAACGKETPALLLVSRVEVSALARKAAQETHLAVARDALKDAADSHLVGAVNALDSAAKDGTLCETGVAAMHALRTASAFFSHPRFSSVSAHALTSLFGNLVPPSLLDAARSATLREAADVSTDERDAALLCGVRIAGELSEADAAVAASAAELERILVTDTSAALTAARLAEKRAESLLSVLSSAATPPLPTHTASALRERANRLHDCAHVTIALTQVSAAIILNAGLGLGAATVNLIAAVDRARYAVAPRVAASSLTLSAVRDISTGSVLLQSLLDSSGVTPTALALTGLDPSTPLGHLIESACGAAASCLSLTSGAAATVFRHILSRNADAGSLAVGTNDAGFLKALVDARNGVADAVLSNALDDSLAAAVAVLRARAFKVADVNFTAARAAELTTSRSVAVVHQFVGLLELRRKESLVGVLPLALARARVLVSLHEAAEALAAGDWEGAHVILRGVVAGAASTPSVTSLGVLATRVADARTLLSLSTALSAAPISPRQDASAGMWPGVNSSAIRTALPALSSALQSAEGTSGASTALGPVLRAASAALSLRRAIVTRDWSSARLLLAARAPLGAPAAAALWPAELCDAWAAIASVIDSDAIAAASEVSSRTLSHGSLFNVLVAQREEGDAEMNADFDVFASSLSSGLRALGDGVERGAGDAVARHLIAFGHAVTRALSAASLVVRAIVSRDAAEILLKLSGVLPALDAARGDLCVCKSAIDSSAYTLEDADDIDCALTGSFSIVDTLRDKVRRAGAAAALSNALAWSSDESPASAADRATAAVELARSVLEHVDSSAPLGYFFDRALPAQTVVATVEGLAAIRAARVSRPSLAATGASLSHALLFVPARNGFAPSLASLELHWSEHVCELIAAHTALVDALSSGGEVAAAVVEASAVLERVSTSTAAASEPALILLSAVPIGAAFARLRDAVYEGAEDVSDAAAAASAEVVVGARRAGFGDALIAALEAESRGDAATHAFSSVASALLRALSQTHGRAGGAAGISTRALREAVAAASSVLALDVNAHGAARVHALAAGASSLIEIRDYVRAGDLAAARARAKVFRQRGGEAARLAGDELAAVEAEHEAMVESTHSPTGAASSAALMAAFDHVVQHAGGPESPQTAAESEVAELDILTSARQSLARAVSEGSLPAIVDATLHLKGLLCHALAHDPRFTTALPVVRTLLAGKEEERLVSPSDKKVDAVSFTLSSCPALRSWTDWRVAVGAAARFSAPLEVAPPPVRDCIAVDWLATRAEEGGVLTVSPVSLTTSAARAVLAHDVAAMHRSVGEFVSGGVHADRDGVFLVAPRSDDEPTPSAVTSALDALRCVKKHAPALDDELYFSLARFVAGGEDVAANRALSLMGAAARADIVPSSEAENHVEWFLRCGCGSIADTSTITERLAAPPPPLAAAVLKDVHAAVARSLLSGDAPAVERELSASLFRARR